MIRLPSREVHLDFHTSELIPEVGTRFSKANFQQALLLGHLNSITVFAKCHHSWSYYPTKVGVMHPALSFDLTGAMINAAHEIGVQAPVYITVGWSANDAENHPEWVVRNKDGTIAVTDLKLDAEPDEKRPIVSWKFMCPNSGYAGLVYSQTKEICDRYPVLDGLFFDICFGPLCWCNSCVEGMKKAGLNPEKDDDAKLYHRTIWQYFMTQCAVILGEKHKDATLFFNGGADPYHSEWHDWQTHFEMEDLPTTWGGYDKMPVRAKYFARTGKDYLGMTGKFHTMWGEFGGFKSAKALRYECAAMLAYGARCSVGDQMHPCGEMDLETYRIIGEAYKYVEEVEQYGYDVIETSRLGIMLSWEKKSDEGLVKMLLEKQLDFDIVLEKDDLSRFDAIILPDCVLLDENMACKINNFIKQGGCILLTGISGLDCGKSRFIIDTGASYQGSSAYENDYVKPEIFLCKDIVESPFLLYEAAQKVSVTDGEVLASIREPYFNRTYGHYCSHQNTPYKLDDAEYPAAVRKGNVVYLAHQICRLYFEHGAQFHRDYFINALKLIYKDPVMNVSMPSSGRARFVKQPRENRYLLHLLYATPIQRGRASVIEDLPSLFNIKVSVKVSEKIRSVHLAPQHEEISFLQENDTVSFVVPKVQCHQILVLEY